MLRGLRYIAARPDGRMHHLDTNGPRANTITALMARNLVTQDVARGTVLFYAITPAGRAAAGVDEPITDSLFAQADEVAPEPAPTQDTLTEDQAAGMACVACGVDFRQVAVPSVPAGRGSRGQVFRCLGCSDASDAHGDEVDAPGEEPDDEVEPGADEVPNAYGENAMPGWGVVDVVRWAIDDLLEAGELPFMGDPIPTATVPRTYRTGGDGAYAPTAHPNDLDGGSPFWRACKTITLPPLR